MAGFEAVRSLLEASQETAEPSPECMDDLKTRWLLGLFNLYLQLL